MLMQKAREALSALARRLKSPASNSVFILNDNLAETDLSQRPLRFIYLYSGGKFRQVELYDWVEDGAFVEGRHRNANVRECFMKLRMWEWQDTSYRQLTGFTPRKGAPID
jgi:hypothetical protein